MEFATAALNFIKTAMLFAGGILTLLGMQKYGEGHGHDNPGLKDTGGKMVVGGIIMAAAGLVLIPQLITLIPQAGGTGTGGGGTPQGLLRAIQVVGLMR